MLPKTRHAFLSLAMVDRRYSRDGELDAAVRVLLLHWLLRISGCLLLVLVVSDTGTLLG